MSANDRQEGGDHYKRIYPEPWDVIADWELGYLLGNVVKYVARARPERSVQDLKKAAHYLEKQIERWEADEARQRPKEPVPTPTDHSIPRCPYCGHRGEHSMACPSWEASRSDGGP